MSKLQELLHEIVDALSNPHVRDHLHELVNDLESAPTGKGKTSAKAE